MQTAFFAVQLCRMRKLNDTATGGSERESTEKLAAREIVGLRKELKKWERILDHGRHGWKEVPKALINIRDRRLYRGEGFSDFASYCAKRGLKKSTLNRHIAVGEVYSFVASTGAKVLPTAERQMRPLLSLRKSDESAAVWGPKVAQVWDKAVSDAELTKCRRPTEKSVIRAMEQLGFAPDPKDVQSTFHLEQAWTRLEKLLWHEREFWPQEFWAELELRLSGLLCGWNGQVNRACEEDETPTEASSTVVDVESPASDQSSPVPGSTEKISSEEFNVWSHVNWGIGNSDLAAIWGLKPNTVKQTRHRQKRGPALDCDPADYDKLLEAEKEKAKKLIPSPER